MATDGVRQRWSRGPVLGASIVAGVIVVALAAGVIVWVLNRTDHTVDFRAAGVAPTTVTVHGSRSAPVVTALEAPPATTVPPAVRLLSRPVRIKAEAFRGEASLTMTYDPSMLPAGADPRADLALFVLVPDADIWLPAGGTVDPQAHTVTLRTTHFSDWVLAVTDPAELANQQDYADRLEKSGHGVYDAVFGGRTDSLTCDPRHPLLPATVRVGLVLNTDSCEEMLDDGSYRLQWVNNTGLPVVIDVPPGFTAVDQDRRLDPSVQKLIAAYRHPRGAFVLPGRSLTLTFAGAALPKRLTITGDVDWGLWLLGLERGIVSAALLDDESSNPKLKAKLDAVFAGADVVDCAAEANATFRKSANLLSGLKAGVQECLTVIAEVLKATVGGLFGIAKEVIRGFISRRVLPILSIPKLLKLAMDEINGLFVILNKPFTDVDTTVSIRPVRAMSHAEAVRLPLAQPHDPTGREPCAPLTDPYFLPAGMPDPSLCMESIALDLDGNREPDRLVSWRPRSNDPFGELDPKRLGLVAYLDDGSVHRMQNPPAGWGDLLGRGGANLFTLHYLVHAGADRRQQAIITLVSGANTYSDVMVAMDLDRRLRAVTADGATGPFKIFDGGGAAATSSFGCVLSRGAPHFVLKSTTTDSLASPTLTYTWTRTYFRLDGTTLREVGSDTGRARDNGSGSGRLSTPTAGSDCTQADPARRGPEIGNI